MIFDNQDFQRIWIRDQTQIPDQSFTFRGCTFDSCVLRVRSAATQPLVVRDVELEGCTVKGGGELHGVALVDCSLRNVKLPSGRRHIGCTFEHVTISGRLRQLMIHEDFAFAHDPEPFRQWTKNVYSSIDWALDITGLVCPDLDIRGVPSRLIRYDPDRHFVIRKDALEGKDWRSLDLRGPSYWASLGLLEDSDWEDKLLTIPTGKDRERALEVLRLMRDAGLVEA